jgi:quinoprotein glucose dehydrogenase
MLRAVACSACVAMLCNALPVAAKPEYFAGALRFGAADCAFCHLEEQGGEGLNERGNWLLAERDRRQAAAVDVAWLEARETVVEAPAAPVAPAAAPVPVLPALALLPEDRARPFDYTTRHGEWPAYAGDLQGRKYAPLDQVHAGNAADLRVAWVWDAFDNKRFLASRDPSRANDGFKATPLMVGGRVFVRTAYSAVAALDAATGATLWTFDPGTGDGPRPPMFGFSTRGLAYHRDAGGERLILLTSDGFLIALDPAKGKPLPGFGERVTTREPKADYARVDLSVGLRRPLRPSTTTWNYAPAICGDTIVVGNQTTDGSHVSRGRGGRGGRQWQENVPLGDVRGFDVHTGRQLWVFRTVPQPGEFGHETWQDGSWQWMGNTNVWSSMSCDPELGHAYLPVTAPTHHFFGGMRPGDNLFGTSLVAVDAKTGERVWHFQAVHHDIWDYDLPAQPVVADITVDGKPRKVVAQVGKTGFLYVIDRLTGTPVWPVEERPVPASTLATEQASPTQPFPTWPPPFEPNGLTEDDLIDFTPALRKRALATLQGHRHGPMFVPPSEEGSLMNPGYGGGANWGGASFDPETHRFYVASRRSPTLLTARPVDADRYGYRYLVATSRLDVEGLNIVKPPWASITAYDLDSGNIAWRVANGAGPRDHRLLRGLDLPDLGAPGAAPGMLVTKSLIFFGLRPGSRVPSVLRAIDKQDGRVVAEHPLQGVHLSAPPMAYMAGGRQFIVIATGATGEPARLTAFRLP